MSSTSFDTSNALTKKVWIEQLFRDSVKESYFLSRFVSKGPDNIVTEKTELSKGPGDEATIGLRMRLSAPGVEEGQALEGNEESLSTYSMKILLKQYRHAVKSGGELSDRRSIIKVPEEARMSLKDWMSEKTDKLCFDEIGIGSGATTDPTKIFYKTSSGVLATGTAATAKGALTSADSKLTLNMISYLKTWAQTGGARTYIPLRPVKIKGKDYYVLLVHNDALYDLRADTNFQQAMREAEVRGSENPLFTGAVAIWDQVVVHAHEDCYVATDGGGASVPWTKGVFMGAQALCWAWGARPELVEETFDYGDKTGWGIKTICAVKKSKFNSLDYGSLGVYLARTNVSGS